MLYVRGAVRKPSVSMTRDVIQTVRRQTLILKFRNFLTFHALTYCVVICSTIIDHRISWSRQNVIYSICKIICFDVLILSIQVSSFFILNLIQYDPYFHYISHIVGQLDALGGLNFKLKLHMQVFIWCLNKHNSHPGSQGTQLVLDCGSFLDQ